MQFFTKPFKLIDNDNQVKILKKKMTEDYKYTQLKKEIKEEIIKEYKKILDSLEILNEKLENLLRISLVYSLFLLLLYVPLVIVVILIALKNKAKSLITNNRFMKYLPCNRHLIIIINSFEFLHNIEKIIKDFFIII
jgi:hypothetical protein